MPDVDKEELVERARAALRRHTPDAEVVGLSRLEGGVSSLTYAAEVRSAVGEVPVVVKVAPPGLEPVRNRDVLRQARLLRLLAGDVAFPVPAVLAEDAGDPPGVPPLFVMSRCPGESYEPGLDVMADPPSSEIAAERMRVAARALARLHAHDPARLGLDDAPGTPSAELDRWRRLFETVDPDIAPGRDELAGRLAAMAPDTVRPRVLHGDYRLANMLFTGTRLEAVIDWEIWSVGDPRPDLAWLLMHTDPSHVFHDPRPDADRAAGSALPSTAELIDVYRASLVEAGVAAVDVEAATSGLGWFVSLCHFKTASTIAVIWKRERLRDEPQAKLVTAAAHLDDVLAAGLAAMG